MLQNLHEDDVLCGHHAQAACGGEAHGLGVVSGHDTYDAAHPQGKVLVGDGLHHEVDGVHLVPAHGVLGEVGHKDERCDLVLLPNDLRGFHAVDAGQANIKKDHVGRVVALKEL